MLTSFERMATKWCLFTCMNHPLLHHQLLQVRMSTDNASVYNNNYNVLFLYPYRSKVITHEGTNPCDLPLQLVPWKVYLKGLVARTCPTNSSHEAFRGTSRGDQLQGLKLVAATRFWSKNDQLTRWDLSPRLVAGTSPFVCADLKVSC